MPAFVICGPTAVGKGTIVRELLAAKSNMWLSVSATTRTPREGERDGTDYYFVSPERFDELIADGDMLEWATVHGVHRYGTPRAAVDEAMAKGKIVILEVDLDGARQIRASMPSAHQIFISPPTFEDLETRLETRGTEGPSERARRLETARVEMAAKDEFDSIVINDDVARATGEILSIMTQIK